MSTVLLFVRYMLVPAEQGSIVFIALLWNKLHYNTQQTLSSKSTFTAFGEGLCAFGVVPLIFGCTELSNRAKKSSLQKWKILLDFITDRCLMSHYKTLTSHVRICPYYRRWRTCQHLSYGQLLLLTNQQRFLTHNSESQQLGDRIGTHTLILHPARGDNWDTRLYPTPS